MDKGTKEQTHPERNGIHVGIYFVIMADFTVAKRQVFQ